MSYDIDPYLSAATGVCAGVAGLSVLHWLLTKTNRLIDAVADGSASTEDIFKLIGMAMDTPAVRERIVKAEQYWRSQGDLLGADRLQTVLERSSPGTASIQQNPSQTQALPNPSSQSSSRSHNEGARRVQQPSPTRDQRRRGQHSSQVQPPFFATFDIESQQQPVGSERVVRNQGDLPRDGSRRLRSGLRHDSDVNASLPREATTSPARQEGWIFSRRPSGQVRQERGPRQSTSGQEGFQRGPEQAAPGGAQQQSGTRGTTQDRSPQPPRSRQTTQEPHLPLVGSRQPIPGRARRRTEQAQSQNQPRPSPLPSHQPKARDERGQS